MAGGVSAWGAVAGALLLGAGCLTSSGPEVRVWTVEPAPGRGAPRLLQDAEGGGRRTFGVARLGPVTVSAPCDRAPFVLRRADGSIAFDRCNVFAAAPAALLRAPLRACLADDAKFGRIVQQASAASADVQVEALVRDLSLEAHADARRPLTARVAVTLDVVRTGRGGRAVAFSADGEATCDVAAGNYTAAFSSAFEQAVRQALARMDASKPGA